MQCAAATVDLVVQKVQFAGAAPSLLTIQADLNNGLCIRSLAGARMPVRNVICLAHIEVEVDRIERDNGSKSRGIGRASADQTTDGNAAHARAAVKRRDDAGKFQIKLRGPDGRFGRLDSRRSSTLDLCALIQKLVGCKLLSVQPSGARDLLICQLQSGSGRLTLRGRLLQLDFIWTRVDDKEQIALADNLAILEMDFAQVAADLSAQSDLIHSGKLSRKLGSVRDVFPKRERHGYDRRRRRNGSAFGHRRMRAKTPDAGAREYGASRGRHVPIPPGPTAH